MNKNPQIDPSTRRILNSNRGITNIADMMDERENIVRLLNRFTTLLFRHCGPLSQYAMTVNAESAGIAFEPNVFTRDGIDILSAVECMSPLETYIKELLCYLGSRVDNAAKDGTTTSMLFGALFLKELLKRPLPVGFLTSYQKKVQTNDVFSFIRKQLTDIGACWDIDRLCPEENFTEKDVMQVAGLIAFAQAMSSSGGDIELASAMKKIYERSPRITWDFIEHYQSASESGDRFTVEIDDFDSKIRCTATQEGALNTALGTEFYEKDIRCIVYADSFSTYDSKMSAMIDYLKKAEDEHSILIVMTHVPGQFLSAIMQINESREHKITVWQYSAEDKLAGQALNWELMIVNAVAGVTPYNHSSVTSNDPMSDAYTFMAKEVRWRNTYLEFYGTIEQPDTDSCLHPYYADPSLATPYYTEVLQELLTQRDMYNNNRIKNEKLVGIFTEMLNRITCLHRPRLRLGGPAHEQIANIPVVKDVQGAIMSSLRHGFLLNGVLELTYAVFVCIGQILNCPNVTRMQPDEEISSLAQKISMSTYQSSLLSIIALSLAHITETLYRGTLFPSAFDLNTIYQNLSILFHHFQFTHHYADSYINVLKFKELTNTDTVEQKSFVGSLRQYFHLIHQYEDPEVRMSDEEYKELLTNYPVIQPIRITDELFRRTQELLMKFSSISEIIVYGGVMVKEKEE